MEHRQVQVLLGSGEKGRVKYILRQMNTRWREPLSK